MNLAPYSMSRVLEYDRCPRRFYFKYIEKLPEIVENAGFFGGKVHEAIAKALRGQEWEETLADLPYDDMEDAKIKVLTAIKYSKDLGQIVGIETRFALTQDLKVTDFFEKDAWFRGIIDLIVRNSKGYYEIWDWKTGHSKPTRFQVALYAWAVMLLLQQPVTKAGYILLSSNEVLEFELTPQDIGFAEMKLKKLIKKIENDTKWQPTPGNHCAYCSYVSQCPLAGAIKAKDIPAIRNDEEAQEVFKTIKVLEEKVKKYKKALNGYVEQKDTGKLKLDKGEYKLMYSSYLTTKRKIDRKELQNKVLQLINNHNKDLFDYVKLETKALEEFKDDLQDFIEERKRKTFKYVEEEGL